MRCVTNNRARAAALILLAAFAAGCRSESAERTMAVGGSAQPAAATVPHGDHNPHHGGVVLMKGDLHYEVVLDPTGAAYQLYFTDAVRDDLPASIASSAALTIKRPGAADEPIALRIDDAGESWIGNGKPVASPLKTMATVSFTIAREPYSIDVPFTIPPPSNAAPR